MQLREIIIRAYKGIEFAKVPVGPGGVIIQGRSKSGKTSIRDAVIAGLVARGVSPDKIRRGHDESEILLAGDCWGVRRVLRREKANILETDGFGLGKPQTRLNETFGEFLDPAALANADKDERRRMIGAVQPATVTADDLLRWTGDEWTPAEGKHGLEVIGDVRKHYYDLRTAANKDAKAAATTAKARKAEADGLAAGAPQVALTVEEAQAGVAAAEKAMVELEARKRQAAEQEARAAGTRERIVKLRADYAAILASANDVPLSEWEQAKADVAHAEGDVAKLEQQLAEARGVLRVASERMGVLERRQEACNDATAKAARLYDQARDLEDTLAETAIAAPTDAEIAAAADSGCKAATSLRAAQTVAAARAATTAYEAAKAEADATAAAAAALDVIVERLTKDAPTELAMRAGMIPGLTFTEDGDIALDGVHLEDLSGAEQLELCTAIAKRASPGKLICSDHLEHMDPELREKFVRSATADGWQLIGTLVTAGELRTYSISADGDVDDEPAAPAQDPKAGESKPLDPKRRVKVEHGGKEIV